MRILHIVASGARRGAEVFASDLIACLNQTGRDQRVVLLRDGEPSAVSFGAPTTVLGAGGFELPGVRVAPRAIRALREVALAWKPDIVQAHGGETLKYAAFAGLHRSCPVVLRSIGAAPAWIRHGPRKHAYQYLLRRSARVVVVAQALRDETIRDFRVPEGRVVVIPNAVDGRRLQPERGGNETRRLLGIPPDHWVLLSVGALTWEKDPLAQLEVGRRIALRRGRFTHLFAGDGPMRQRVEQAARGQGREDQVRLLGSRPDIADVICASDVVLFASRSDGMEGMPATVIEAGMMARPVVCYAVAGVPEVVEDGITGLLVLPGDLDGLAERALGLLEDEGKRAAMGAAARERCRSLFDIRMVAPQYVRVYDELAGQANR